MLSKEDMRGESIRQVEHALRGAGSPRLIHVVAELGDDAWHGYGAEKMWAEPVDRARVRLRNVPFFALGMSNEDVVEVEGTEEPRRIVRVAQPGGHSTYRIFLADGIDQETFAKSWAPLATLGCEYERATDRLYAVDVPPMTDIHTVYAQLERGQRAGVWDFQEGHCGHPVIS
jgi:hypothetical protein